MTPSSVASLFVFCLLVLVLPALHGASSKTPGLGNNKLPVVQLQSTCSRQRSLTAADVLHRDASLIRRCVSSQSSSAMTKIPTNGSSDPLRLPGTLHYNVLVSYATPEQQLPVFLNTSSVGASMLRCKACASRSNDCDLAFDPSRSSTFVDVLCGMPDCPTNCFSDSFRLLDGTNSIIEGAFAEDMLTLVPSMAVDDFRFVSVDVESASGDLPVARTLDISCNPNSVLSQLSSSGLAPAAAFSYCLPKSPNSEGYLISLGIDASIREKHVTTHARLVSNSNPELPSMYLTDLVEMILGIEILPIPRGIFRTNLDMGTRFTLLTPAAYEPLHDSFRRQMSQNNISFQGFHGFETCFNLTGVRHVAIPVLTFKFGNGEKMLIDFDQMLYYDDPTAAPFTMTCLAFSSLDAGDAFSVVIGTHTLASTEVVYDVAGGKVGFIPRSC